MSVIVATMHFSATDYVKLMALYQEEYSVRPTAASLGFNRSVVQRVIQKFREFENIVRMRGSGRERSLSRRNGQINGRDCGK